MLAEHIVNVDISGDTAVLLQMAYLDSGRARDVVDQPQLARPDGQYRISDGGIIGNAALKLRRGGGLLDLTDEIDVCCGMPRALRRGPGTLRDEHVGDDADQQRRSGGYSEKLADGRSHAIALQRRDKPDGSFRATHGDDLADGLTRCQRGRWILGAQALGVQHPFLDCRDWADCASCT